MLFPCNKMRHDEIEQYIYTLNNCKASSPKNLLEYRIVQVAEAKDFTILWIFQSILTGM